MKKLLSFLLVAILAFCSLSCGNKALSINDFTFGKETSLETEIDNWASDYDALLDEWNEEYRLNKSRWYKIGFESAEYVEEDGDIYSIHVKGSGWYLASPYDFEQKYTLSVTCKAKYITVNEEDDTKKTQVYSTKLEETYIQGVTYTKMEGKISEENSVVEQVDYSHESYVKTLMSERSFLGYNVFSLLNYGTFDKVLTDDNGDLAPTFVKNKKFSVYSYSNDYGETKTKHYIGQVESRTPFIKGLKLFYKYTHEAEAQTSISHDGEENPVYDHVKTYKLTVNPSFFGFVSRPRDYHKYF